MVAILQFIRGYVRIKVWGFSPERFMNLCSFHDILLWDIRKEDGFHTMCVSLRGFRRLRPIARKTKARVAILQRYGLPFFMPFLWKRKVFLLGLLLCVSFWIFSSYFIWDIEVSGNERITSDQFLSYLRLDQIAVGMKKKDLDIEELEKGLRRQFDEITWASARLEGTKLIIEVKENDAPTQVDIPQEGQGMDLAAPFDGTIVSMIVRKGVPKVQIGDAVSSGQVLVEGRVPVYNEDATVREYEYVSSDADITIEHRLQRMEELPWDYLEKRYTGRTLVRHFVRIGKWLFQASTKRAFLAFDQVTQEKAPLVFEKLSIPVLAGSVTYREYQNVEREYSQEEAGRILSGKMNEFFRSLEEKGVHITQKDVKIEKGAGAWVMSADLTVQDRALRRVETQAVPEGEAKAGG